MSKNKPVKFSKHPFLIPMSQIFLDDDFLLKPKPFIISKRGKHDKQKNK
jgi:hypothetical protein